jgi:hypothetical protein
MITAAHNLARLPIDLVTEYGGYLLRIAAAITDALLMSAFPAPAQRRATLIASAGQCTSRNELMDWARLARPTRFSPVDGEASCLGRPLGPAAGERPAPPPFSDPQSRGAGAGHLNTTGQQLRAVSSEAGQELRALSSDVCRARSQPCRQPRAAAARQSPRRGAPKHP